MGHVSQPKLGRLMYMVTSLVTNLCRFISHTTFFTYGSLKDSINKSNPEYHIAMEDSK